MKVTRKDIAKMAGVSTATVSYVINGSNRVGEETRERVQRIIEEYNYRPDLIARAMSTRSTMQIALLVNDLFNNFFAEIVTEFEKAAIQQGYCVNICTSDRSISNYIDSFVTRRMDGVFCMVSPTRIDLQKLYALRQDYAQGMLIALEYLKGCGHRRIAYLSAFPQDFECDNRLKMFLKYYDQIFPTDEKLLITGDYPFPSTVDAGYDLA